MESNPYSQGRNLLYYPLYEIEKILVPLIGLEPTKPATSTRCLYQFGYKGINCGADNGIRTHTVQILSLLPPTYCAMSAHKYVVMTNTLIDSTFMYARANSSVQWLGTDTPANYKAPNLYLPTDIEYKFNSHGFRCDEFSLPSELPIVFLGCSFTEGVGLHQHETWSYQLIEKIRNKTNKNIPYWNLGLGGTGIDTQSRLLYFLTTILNIKVQYVFSLIPTISRREYKVINDSYRNWLPAYRCKDAPLGKHIDSIFSDVYFSTHQTERSLMTIDSICRQNGAKMICSTWDNTTDITQLTNSFPLIDSFQSNISMNNRAGCARDNIHPGPVYHQKLANVYWDHSEKYFSGLG